MYDADCGSRTNFVFSKSSLTSGGGCLCWMHRNGSPRLPIGYLDVGPGRGSPRVEGQSRR